MSTEAEYRTHLNAGDAAPDFNVIDENGKHHQLSDYKGSKLILFFYPKDLSQSCTKQACNLNDNYQDIRKKGFHVLGISPDTAAKHQKFIDKHGFKYSLLADVDKKMLTDYGTWGTKPFFGKIVTGVRRTTFIIDENGIIQHVIDKVKTKDHWEQISSLTESAD